MRVALASHDIDSFKKIIESNEIDVNTHRDLTAPSGVGPYSIFGEVIKQALKDNDLEFVKYLLRHRADANNISYLNLTPLKMVVEKAALDPKFLDKQAFLLDFIKLLLDYDARIYQETYLFVFDKSIGSLYDKETRFYKKVLVLFKKIRAELRLLCI